MENNCIYKHYLPLRSLFILMLVSGIIILLFFLYLFQNEIYPEIWTFAGPLLSAALILTGLTSFKIKTITVFPTQETIEIEKESLFKSKKIRVKFSNLTSELKTANGKKNSLIPKLKVVIFNQNEEIEELISNFLSLNNSKLKKLHSELKKVSTN